MAYHLNSAHCRFDSDFFEAQRPQRRYGEMACMYACRDTKRPLQRTKHVPRRSKLQPWGCHQRRRRPRARIAHSTRAVTVACDIGHCSLHDNKLMKSSEDDLVGNEWATQSLLCYCAVVEKSLGNLLRQMFTAAILAHDICLKEI